MLKTILTFTSAAECLDTHMKASQWDFNVLYFCSFSSFYNFNFGLNFPLLEVRQIKVEKKAKNKRVWKIIYFNSGERYEDIIDHRSYIKRREIKS